MNVKRLLCDSALVLQVHVIVIGLFLVVSGVSAHSWTYVNSSQFPSVWFGANASGPDAPFLSRMQVTSYSSAYFGWQVENNVNGCKNEERDLSQQASAVKKLKPSVTTTVYAASGSNLYAFYDWQAAALKDPSLQGFFLPKKERRCVSEDGPWRL